MNDYRIYAFADEANPMVDQQIEAMLRNGLQGLEIRGVDGTNIVEITEDKAREVRRKLDDHGLSVWSIGSPIGKIYIQGDDFEKHLDQLKHVVDLAHILGAENIRMFSFYMPEGGDPAQYRNCVLDRLHRMVETVRGSGVALCHENEKGIYGDIAVRCAEILREVPELEGVFDPANFIQVGQKTLEAWELLRDRIKYMHIKDAVWDGSVVPAGKGDGHVPEIVRAYIAKGGRDMTVEPHLMTFGGLKALEREGQKSQLGGVYVFENADVAFDAACQALREILETA